MAGRPTLEELLALMVPQTLHAESRGRDFDVRGRPITSPAGAKYAMQVMPTTMTDPGFGVRPANPSDPADVNRAGRDYLGAMLKRYNLDPAKAWAAYNGGPGRVDRALVKGDGWLGQMPGETRAYVAQNLAALNGRPPQSASPAQPSNPLPSPAMTDSPLASLSASADPTSTSAPPQQSPLDILTGLMGQRDQLDQERAQMRQQQLDAATAALQQQRKGLTPSDLFRLSAALAAPQRSRGFGGMMANVMPVLADVTQGHEQAGLARKNALRQLQMQYMGGTLDDKSGSLDKRLEIARAMGAAQPDKPRQTWSENLGRFISADARQPVGRVVNNGLQGIKFSDGTEEYADTDGTVAVYDAAGRKIATRRGNSTNAAP